MPKQFKDLTQREIQAEAIALEEQAGRVYADFALAGVSIGNP